MTSPPSQSLADALAVYIAALPRQARLIRLAGQVLGFTAQVQADLPPAPAPDLDRAARRLAAGQPVLSPVPVPAPLFRAALGRLTDLFREAELLPPLSPDLLRQVLALPPPAWLAQPEPVSQLCRTPGAPAGLLLFLARQALAPFHQQAAAPYAAFFLQGAWQQGRCPACGQEPTLASFSPGSGQRLLYCSLCAVQWAFARFACPFCGLDQPRYSYLFLEDDPARRADLCQTCHRYLKTILTSRLPHLLSLPLEEFVTVDLDALLARPDLPA